jgi:hypothetical protein
VGIGEGERLGSVLMDYLNQGAKKSIGSIMKDKLGEGEGY